METKKINECGCEIEVMENPIEVKSWFAQKIWKEKFGGRLYDTRIFAVVGETEKAYNCVIGSAFSKIAFVWIPKSCTQTSESKNPVYVGNWGKIHEVITCLRIEYM